MHGQVDGAGTDLAPAPSSADEETPRASSEQRAGSPDEETARGHRLRVLAHLLIAAPLLLQLAILIRRSWAQYQSGAVSLDFAIFYQAWHQIGVGNLNPYSTLVDYPYWRSHFELIMWPLALVGRVFPSGITLLVLQDLAIVGSEAVALLWILDVVRQGRVLRFRHLLPLIAAVTMLGLNHHVRLVAVSDFHFQAFATLLVLAGARALWRGEKRRAWPWLLAALLTGDVAGTYVAGLGLSALVARRDTRRTGLALVLVGAGWTAFVGLLGADRGSALGGYQYLVSRHLPDSGAALLLVLGTLVLHPNRPLAALAAKANVLGTELAGAGALGLLHPWTFGVTAVVLISGGLQENLAFFSPFQNFPAIMFCTVGTALTLDWLGRRSERVHPHAAPGIRPRFSVRPGAVPARCALTGGLLLVGVLFAVGRPGISPTFPQPPGTSRALETVDRALRPQDEVVASFGIGGRFAGQACVHLFATAGSVPVESRRVVFVFSPTIGNMTTPGAQKAAAAEVRALGATPVVETADVEAYAWTPPAGTTTIALP